MNTSIKKVAKPGNQDSVVALLAKENKQINLLEKTFNLSGEELSFVKKQIKEDNKTISVNQYNRFLFFVIIDQEKEDYQVIEQCRKFAHTLLKIINRYKISKITVTDIANSNNNWSLAFAEGLALSNYQFLKYFRDAGKKANSLKNILIAGKGINERQIAELQAVIDATLIARTLVNEPLSYLTAVQYAKDIQQLGKKAGFKVEVFNKKKIESLKMGGLLSVNKGSIDPPTFSIMEWKPAGAKNKKPYVLVGKGIVYDTGGLSLKPTGGSMDEMKCDMAGSAAVVGLMYAVAQAKLPVHIIGLVPATDNRPGENAYVPGDVITMFNGTTVEVLNTDAEGRLVLADALSYASRYKPELVIDLATLTGAAVRSVGTQGIVSMGTASEEVHKELQESGKKVYERLAPMPFWEEYGEMIKSDIADLKNIGGAYAGAITAGKFLEHFTKDHQGKVIYPWIHLDIAGPAFINFEDSYRGKWGTGSGVRLLFDFFKNR